MEKSFEIIVLSYQYNFGSKIKEVFKNKYGTWTIFIVSSHHCSLNGTIVLNPSFDETIIDWKMVKIDVECNNPKGHNFYMIAQHLEKTTFTFGPTDSLTNYSKLFYEVAIKIEMPEISYDGEKQVGVKNYLKSLFDSKNDADIIIKAEDAEIKAHKLILKRSDVFAKMLSDTINEAQNKVIETEDIKFEVAVEICRFLYCDEIPKLETLALPLLIAANKYKIKNLGDKCEKFLMTNITLENFHDVLIAADQLNKEKLLEAAFDYVVDNCKSIFSSDTWMSFKKSHTELAMIAMEKFVLKNKLTS